ncbi:MAG: HYR domain-containing protein [Bacteroidota bacterium]
MRKITFLLFFMLTAIVFGQNNPPVATCANYIAQLDASGTAVILPADVDGGSTDPDGDPITLSLDNDTFTCANIGPGNIVTLTVMDDGGLSDSCTAMVTVVDMLPPVASCMNMTVTLDFSGNATITPNDINNGSTDNCGSVALSLSQTTFSCADVGATTVTLTVTDGSGNSSNCMATVTVNETSEPLQANCQDITISLDASGNASIVAADIDNMSTGDSSCGSLSLSISQDTFTCSDVFKPLPVRDLILTGVVGDTATAARPRAIELYVLNDVSAAELSLYAIGSANPAEGTLTPEFSFPADAYLAGDRITVTTNQTTFTNFFGTAATYVDATAPNIDGNDVVGLFYNGTLIDTFGDINAMEIEPGFELGRLDNWAYTDGWAYRVDNTEQDGATFDFENWFYGGPGSLDGESTNPTAFPFGQGMPKDSFGFINFGSPTPIPVTLTASDGSGSTDMCIANVTVVDNTPPVMSCQNITRQLDAMGIVRLTEMDLYTAPATDACGILRYKVEPSVLDCDNIGPNSVTLTAIDAFGNETSCTSVVTIEDLTPPVAACANITVPLNGMGMATITAEDLLGTSNDPCNIAVQTIDVTTFDCSNIGPNNVQLTLTDSNGNTSSCIAVVTIVDNAFGDPNPPTVTSFIANYTNTPQGYDCGAAMGCDPNLMGDEDETYDCIDGSGNSNNLPSYTFMDPIPSGNLATAIVVDMYANCFDGTLTYSLNGTVIETRTGSDPSCGCSCLPVETFTILDTAGIPGYVYGGNNTLEVSVGAGETICAYYAEVKVSYQLVDPVGIECQDLTLQLDASGNAVLDPTLLDNGSFDACGIASFSVDQTSFNCSDLGTNSVLFTATDVNGNSDSCTAIVTIEDAVPPTANAMDISVVLNASGTALISGADVDNGSADNCGVTSVSVSPDMFSCADTGAPVVVTMTVTDASGNTATDTALVTVVDTIAPVANCQNITVALDANGNATITAADIDAGSTVSCGTAVTSIDVSSFDCSNIGANNVELSVTNTNGQTTTCTALVTVEDTTAPAVVCQNLTVILDGSGSGTITPAQIDNGSSDACGIASMSLDVSNFDCSDIGVNNVTLSVTDVNGNVGSCVAQVTVLDDVNPTAVCQNITVQLDASGNVTINALDVDGGSSDFCGIASRSVDVSSFDCSDLGANNVLLTVTDTSGNTDSCIAIVTVEDNIDPMAVCQNITVQLDASGSAFIDPSDLDGGSTDACGIASTTISNNLFNCSNVGSNTVLFTVTDTSGNSSSCSAIVTVEDATAPTVVCQNTTVQLDASGSGFITVANIDAGTNDACGLASVSIDVNTFDCDDIGANNVTLTATDVYGNTASCVAVVTVVDTVDPIINCPSNQTELVTSGGTFTVPDYFANGLASIEDNCTDPIIDISQNPTPGTVLAIGTYTVSLTGEDESGNSEGCNFQLTVTETLGTSDNKNLDMKVVPNPASDAITIYGSSQYGVRAYRIYDLSGRVLVEREQEFTTEEIVVDISHLSSASYVLVVEADKGLVVKQLIKE